MIRAVVFDMDGVLISSEEVWDEVREGLARERGGRWSARAHRDMMGMSTPEWTGYMHREVGLPMSPAEIEAEVVERLVARYRQGRLQLDELITARYPLERINEAIVAMEGGETLRNVIVFPAGETP